MMKFECLLGFAITSLCCCTAWSVDLTPRFSEVMANGVVVRRSFFFADGDKKIGLTLSFDTRVEEGAGGAVFRFQSIPSVVFIIRHSPMPADEPFAGVSLERYREGAHRLLPPNVTSVERLEEIRDPITLNGWRSFRFVMSYVDQGTPRICSVTFVNISEGEQLAFVLSALSKEYDDAAEKMWLVLRTWQPMPAETATTQK